MRPLGFVWFVISALSLFGSQRAKQKWLRVVSAVLFLIVALAMFSHVLPGIHNILIYDKILISPDAVPFSLYFNFDKTWIGLLIYIFVLKQYEKTDWSKQESLFSLKALAVLVVAMLPLVLISRYVHWDPKFPPQFWVWAGFNLFLVCMAEESLFRGFIQGGLANWGAAPSIAIGAILFGLGHYKGGVAYVVFATIAGVAYGLVYWRTKKIEFPILVHFLFNTIHFLLFTYPALLAR